MNYGLPKRVGILVKTLGEKGLTELIICSTGILILLLTFADEEVLMELRKPKMIIIPTGM